MYQWSRRGHNHTLHNFTKRSDCKNPHKGLIPQAERMWSWRESNPRPNGVTLRFLHAYFSL